jgi:hypothetical protein
MWVDLLFAVILALIVSAIFWAIAGWPGIGTEAIALFVLLLFATWAIGAWITPFGPALWGGFWIPFLLPAFFLFLLLAALAPPRPPRSRQEAIEDARANATASDVALFTLGAFFWILLVGLIIAVILAYV